MSLSTRTLLSAAALAACALAPAAQAAVVYSLASGGSQLIRFDTSTPGAVTAVGGITGTGSLGLDGLDFRPADGQLYGYSNQTGGVYTVNTATGAATLVSTLTTPTTSFALGIDFNPTVDRLRVVTSGDQNLRVNVASGATTVDVPLAYAAGDANVGANPNIVDVAYTNSDTNPATGTALYYLDSTLNTLVSTTNPNGGALSTVGALGFDFSEDAGFDILTDFGVNFAFAALSVGGLNGLYSINLGTGAATLIGAIANGTSLYGLAVVPGAAVPEPGTLALLGMAGLAAVWVRRKPAQSSAAAV